MTSSPALLPVHPPFGQHAAPGDGGNWPASYRSVSSGPFLFPAQALHQRLADYTDPNEAVCLPQMVRRTRAAIGRRPAPSRAAKSRAFLFPEVDHVAHGFLSVADTLEDSGGAFA